MPKNGPPYGHVNRPPAVKLICEEVGKTRQSEKDACDVNRLMARYEKTGVMPQDMRPVIYADVSEVGDYRSVVARVQTVERAFMQLPAAVRARFENDAALFLDFATDKANESELIDMGLIEAPEDASGSALPSAPEPSGPETPGEG